MVLPHLLLLGVRAGELEVVALDGGLPAEGAIVVAHDLGHGREVGDLIVVLVQVQAAAVRRSSHREARSGHQPKRGH